METIRKAIEEYGSIIPLNNNFYNSEDWFLNSVNILDRLLTSTQGRRELFAYLETETDIVNAVDDLFMMNSYKYKHLWDLYTAEYNPLWNVDGIEKTEREQINTGTQTNKLSGKDTLAKLGSESDARTGHDDLTRSGSEADKKTGDDTLVQSGSIKDQNGGAVTEARTTFDSAAFLDTDKTSDATDTTTTFNNKQDKTTFNSTNTKTFTNRKDEQAYNSTSTHSFTNRSDETTYGKEDKRTDNLNEKETITYTRGGNIGTTMSQQMAEAEVKWSTFFKFYQTVVSDIANHISYKW